MNIIKAVTTANKIQKVKVKTKKGLAFAGKLALGAAVLGAGALVVHKIKKDKATDKKNKKLADKGQNMKKENALAIAKIEYKKQKKIAKIDHKNNFNHGTNIDDNIPHEIINI